MAKQTTNPEEVIIDLTQSSHAHIFDKNNRIHPNEFKKAEGIIDKHISEYENFTQSDKFDYMRFHKTISVFGGRGSGKTSFLYSILDTYNNGRGDGNKIEVLRIIDPTILEEKGHIFLYIISLINKRVNEELSKKACCSGSNASAQRRDWNIHLASLAKGLPSLDKVGPDYINTNWQDDDFIMDRGLECVDAALDLEMSFHKLVEEALNIIGKKFFMLAFDDIDVHMAKGWAIMECIRKYLTTPRIITILSGNLKFYRNNIRIHQWEQLEPLVRFEAGGGDNSADMENLRTQVNEIEGQYLLKVLSAENRIHLRSILDTIRTSDIVYKIKESADSTPVELAKKYQDILRSIGIVSNQQIEIYKNYLMGLSPRTQISFLKGVCQDKDNRNDMTMLEPFLSRMYASKIDIDLAISNPHMINIVILGYLLHRQILLDSYLLLPVREDANINACTTGLAFLFMSKVRTTPDIVFDYMIRIAYIRNVLLTNNDYKVMQQMCTYAGGTKDVLLKNFVGVAMAYLRSQIGYGMKEHISLYGLAEKGKAGRNDARNRIDAEFNTGNVQIAQRFVGYIPLFAHNSADNNSSDLYYSPFVLLAAIGQIMRVAANERSIITSLKDLQLLRYYSMMSDSTSNTKQSASKSEADVPNEKDLSENSAVDDGSEVLLAKSLKKWRDKNVSAGDISIAPFAIGRAITRFYVSVQKINEDNLGEQMHRSMISLLNAFLIEETLDVEVDKKGRSGRTVALEKLNYGNVITKDDIFEANLNQIKDGNGWEYIKFTKWLAECPLIQTFIKPEVRNKYFNSTDGNKGIAAAYNVEEFSVYEILNNVDIKVAGKNTPDGPNDNPAAPVETEKPKTRKAPAKPDAAKQQS